MEEGGITAPLLVTSVERAGMAIGRGKLFGWMIKRPESAMEFFRLPTDRVRFGSRLRDLMAAFHSMLSLAI